MDIHLQQPNTHYSMKRRSTAHNYCERGIYMLTMAIYNRRPLFGKVVEAKMILSDLGVEVEKQVMNIPHFYPQLEILQVQMMPDHLHVLLFVHEQLPKHLSNVVKGFKIGCNRLYNAMMQTPHTITKDANTAENIPLFESGYHDRILRNHGQLNVLRAYLTDNPRRFWIKQQNRELFKQVSELTYGTQKYTALGNRFLLAQPDKLQVQCSRRLSIQEIAEIQDSFLQAGHQGAVLVSPCISPGEKQIARAALDTKVPLIVLLENGFPEYYKPPKTYFEACAAGRLLMLAPWGYHSDKRAITREQCLSLNEMAAEICGMDAAI